MAADNYGQYHSSYMALGTNSTDTTDPDGGFGVIGAVIGGVVGVGFSLAGTKA